MLLIIIVIIITFWLFFSVKIDMQCRELLVFKAH